VTLHTTNHSWNASHGLKEDDSIDPFALIHLFGIIARDKIESHSGHLDSTISNLVFDAFSVSVGDFDALDILLLVDGVSHPVGFGIHDEFVFGEFIQETLSLLHDSLRCLINIY
jgi:hypothetical protein